MVLMKQLLHTFKRVTEYIPIVLINQALVFEFLRHYLKASTVGGWDGANHFAVVETYVYTHFPSVLGWLHNWNAGMPWPLGYPPLFTLLYGVVRLFFATPEMAFKTIAIIAILILPLIVFKTVRTMGYSYIRSLIVSVIFIFILTAPKEILSPVGLTYYSTFQSGLYPQLVASLFLFLFFMSQFRNYPLPKHKRITQGILLALTILTNIHVGEIGLILLFAFTLGEILYLRRLQPLKEGGVIIGVALLLCSFWAFPLLETLSYFPGMAFEQVSLLSINTAIGFALFSGIVLALSIKYHNRQGIHISLATLFTFAVVILPLNRIFPDLPLQPERLVVYVPAFSIFLIPPLMDMVGKHFALSEKQISLLSLVFIFPFLMFSQPLTFNETDLLWRTEDQQVISYLASKKDSRNSFEVQNPGYPKHFTMAALEGKEGGVTLWNVFRESSLNAPFIVPLRNTLSIRNEDFGIICFLCWYEWDSFNSYTPEVLGKRMDVYNVGYIQATSTALKKKLLDSGQFSIKTTIHDTFILEKTQKSGYAQTLDTPPILLVTEFEGKSRTHSGTGAYNWLRYSEEWFKSADFTTYFVKSPIRQLDDPALYTLFSRIAVDSEKYTSIEQAETLATGFLQNQQNSMVFLIDSPETDPLLTKLINKQFSNLHIIPKSGDVTKDYKALEHVFTKQTSQPNQDILRHTFGKNSIDITLPTNPNADTRYILVKSSYFPYWKDISGGSVFMVSPALMLVVTTKDDIALRFTPSIAQKGGSIISVITLTTLLFISIVPVKDKKHNAAMQP